MGYPHPSVDNVVSGGTIHPHGGNPPAPGHSPLLEENYTVLEALGLGATGRVLRASRKKDGKEVPKRRKRSFHQWGIPNMVAL